MAERVTLQWNVTNWVTVVLMAAIGTAVLGCLFAGVGQWRDTRGSNDGSK